MVLNGTEKADQGSLSNSLEEKTQSFLKILRIMSCEKNLSDKIRGSMVGAVIGNCLGSPVECQFWKGIEIGQVLNMFAEYREMASKRNVKLFKYTDDAALVRRSLLRDVHQNKSRSPC
jgi:hypothetical protein